MRAILIIGGILGGFALSFLGFGLMWIGLSLYVQGAILALLFFAFTFGLGKGLRDARLVFCFPALGAAPVAGLFVQFRNSEGSHLGAVLLVTCWGLGALVGAWLGARPRNR
jgi:hypothetical protein